MPMGGCEPVSGGAASAGKAHIMPAAAMMTGSFFM
jgi:hypothetical protein